jgi:pimeloyl-ACP methyl ester carboxylesterase
MATTNVNGIDLYYEEHGSPHGEPVLLIMGFLMNAAAWGAQIPALAPRYRVIAFDNRGAGRTTQPETPYSVDDMADDAIALLDHLGVDTAHVVGLSMGGMIAQHVVLRHPSRVRTLTLMVTTCGGPHSATYASMLEMRNEADGVTIDGMGGWDADRVHDLLLTFFTPEFVANPGPGLAQMGLSVIQYPTQPHSMLLQGDAMLQHDTWADLPKIGVPTLVMYGGDDPLINPEDSRILASRIPGAEVRAFPGLRHGFNAEKPDEVNAALLEFLGKHAAVGAR